MILLVAYHVQSVVKNEHRRTHGNELRHNGLKVGKACADLCKNMVAVEYAVGFKPLHEGIAGNIYLRKNLTVGKLSFFNKLNLLFNKPLHGLVPAKFLLLFLRGGNRPVRLFNGNGGVFFKGQNACGGIGFKVRPFRLQNEKICYGISYYKHKNNQRGNQLFHLKYLL